MKRLSEEAFCPHCLEKSKYTEENECLKCGGVIPDGIIEMQEEIAKLSLPLWELKDDEGEILLCRTNMTEDEMKEYCVDETLDEKNMDYEEKLNYHAEVKGLYFERVHTDIEVVI